MELVDQFGSRKIFLFKRKFFSVLWIFQIIDKCRQANKLVVFELRTEIRESNLVNAVRNGIDCIVISTENSKESTLLEVL
jgi:hypothetical protein